MAKYPFIVFEGIDGSGKSTQSKLLVEALEAEGIDVHATFEPTNNFIGQQIRNILTKKIAGHPLTIANLFAADRCDHLTHADYGMINLLEKGPIVCDRYLLSSYAYQSMAAPMEWIKEINKFNEDLLWPDHIFYIKILPELALERISVNRTQIDLFETKDQLEKIFNNYELALNSLTVKQQETIHIIDGTQDKATIHQLIKDILKYK